MKSMLITNQVMKLFIVNPCMPLTIDLELFSFCQEDTTWVCMFTCNLILPFTFQSQCLRESPHIRMPWHILHCQLWCGRTVRNINVAEKRQAVLLIKVKQQITVWPINLRSTVCYAFDFNKIRLPDDEEFRISIYIFRIPSFHKCQAIYSSLMFLFESFQGILNKIHC